MTTIIWIILIAGIVVGGLVYWNHYDVTHRGNPANYDPGEPLLRTADERFAELDDFPFEPNYVEIRDGGLGLLRVHYLDEGPSDGKVVVLLHGQATWSYSFRKMIPILVAAGYRVIVPDLIGFGRSDKPSDWEAHTFERHVAWLDATLQALNIQHATGFLFDWGGYFALRVAAERPEVFDRLVLCTTTMPRANSMIGSLWVAGWRRYIYKPAEFPISGMVDEMTSTELDAATKRGLDAPYPNELYKAGPRRFPLMIPATFMNPATEPNREAWEKLSHWNKPTLTLVSETLAKRGFNPDEFIEQMPGTKGQAHATFPDTGFFIIEDVPAELAEHTLDFISANP